MKRECERQGWRKSESRTLFPYDNFNFSDSVIDVCFCPSDVHFKLGLARVLLHLYSRSGCLLNCLDAVLHVAKEGRLR